MGITLFDLNFDVPTGREQRPQDFLDCIVDLREYDVPYHVRFAIDNGNFLFCFSVSFQSHYITAEVLI